MRMGEAEREVLRKAAEAAVPIRQQLQAEIALLQKRMASLDSIIEAYEDSLGRRRPSASGGDESGARPRKTKKNEVARYIDAVLIGTVALSETSLRETINGKFGVDVPRGTVYSTLRRGRRSGKYTHEGGLWQSRSE